MKIGIGLPTTIPGAPPALLTGWARAADAGPFATLGAHDRLAYPGLEPLLSLAAAAVVTARVRLAALVVIGPLRSPALLAKQAATVTALSGGRLVLGLGLGPRREDYELGRVDWHARGRLLDAQLRYLLDQRDRAVEPAGGGDALEILVGGLTDQAVARAVRHADGFVHAGGPPPAFAAAAVRVRAAWSDAGRPGRPRLWGLGYFALGPGAADAGAATLRAYYGFAGGLAERIADGLLTTPAAVRALVRGYAEAGCDELVLFPTVGALDQVARLAEVVPGLPGVAA